MENANVNDIVGFCPHEDLTGQGKEDKFCGFMVPGQFRMNFAGKKNTIIGARIAAAAPRIALAKVVKDVAPEPDTVPAEQREEAPVEAPVDPVVEDTAEEEHEAQEQPVEAQEQAPVKKQRRTRRKKA